MFWFRKAFSILKAQIRNLPPGKSVMARSIQLTDKESLLRQLLLDTSAFISSSENQNAPQLRITGGWVRDKLLGSTSHDIDIGIDSMNGAPFAGFIKSFLESPQNNGKYPADIMRSFSKITANPEKSKHLETAMTTIMGFDLDFVNLRKEVYSQDSRNPQMEFGTPEEDALRRDSTINALFYNLQTSEVEDLTKRGIQDLDLKLIKTPLPPRKTFTDDPLRILRSIRFASRLGFRIDPEDEMAMSDKLIHKDLRAKVSRERVGIEVTKMLQGPDPHAAVCCIDRFGLYNIVFTRFVDPEKELSQLVDTGSWSVAYNQLLEITKPIAIEHEHGTHLKIIAEILLPNAKETYLAWLICCFVPWAREKITPAEIEAFRPVLSAAGAAAREGIKADNETRKIIEGAALNVEDIDKTTISMTEKLSPIEPRLKRKAPSVRRETQGKAIRRWGSQWRSSVMYALLVHISEAKYYSERLSILSRYASWLSEVESLKLLDAHALKPLVNGNQIMKALEKKGGPWMAKALEMAIAWQLRNPDETDEKACIEDIVLRRKELDSMQKVHS